MQAHSSGALVARALSPHQGHLVHSLLLVDPPVTAQAGTAAGGLPMFLSGGGDGYLRLWDGRDLRHHALGLRRAEAMCRAKTARLDVA